MNNPSILYGDTVKYKDKIGLVKHVSGSYAEVKFDNIKKNQLIPVNALEKING
jgi:hypothetical protein